MTIKLNGLEHTWEFEELGPDKVVVKALIPDDQSAGMVESAAEVVMTFWWPYTGATTLAENNRKPSTHVNG